MSNVARWIEITPDLVVCRRCEAGPGDPCSGSPPATWHQARVGDAEIASLLLNEKLDKHDRDTADPAIDKEPTT